MTTHNKKEPESDKPLEALSLKQVHELGKEWELAAIQDKKNASNLVYLLIGILVGLLANIWTNLLFFYIEKHVQSKDILLQNSTIFTLVLTGVIFFIAWRISSMVDELQNKAQYTQFYSKLFKNAKK